MLLRTLLLFVVCCAVLSQESDKCGRLLMRLNEHEGTLQYPMNERYPPSAKCHWPLQATQGDKSVEISFKSIDIDGSPPSCRSDSLSVLSPVGRVLARFCGSTVPRVQRFPYGSVTLEFNSNSEKEGAGFLLSYKFLQSAPSTPARVITAASLKDTEDTEDAEEAPPSTLIHGPTTSGKCDPMQKFTDTFGRLHFIHTRTGRYRCRWTIAAPSSMKASHVLLVFSKVTVGDSENCRTSALKVTWADSSSNYVCGRNSTWTKLYMADSVTLEFTGTTSPQQTGFDVTFTFLPSDERVKSARRPFNMDYCAGSTCVPLIPPGETSSPITEAPSFFESTSEMETDHSMGESTESSENAENTDSTESSPENNGSPELKCGVHDINVAEDRIVGGTPAVPHSWPWMTSVAEKAVPVCGSALISNQWVLSAAHCFQGSVPSEISLRFGAHNLRAAEGSTVQRGQVARIVRHPHYNARTHDNDIALLQLARPVTFTKYVQPICLPKPNAEPSVTDQFMLLGWGEDQNPANDEQTALREVTIPFVTKQVCQRRYRTILTPNMFCAGEAKGGKDSCQGDSGGPVQVLQGSRYVQVGVVSFGIKCALPGTPGVYTQVSNYIDWIQKTMGQS